MISLGVIDFYMCSHITGPVFPFKGGIRGTHTVFSGGIFNDFLAAFTLFNNRVAAAPIILASFLAHKDALKALS